MFLDPFSTGPLLELFQDVKNLTYFVKFVDSNQNSAIPLIASDYLGVFFTNIISMLPVY